MSHFVQPVGPAVILPPTVLGVFRLFFTTALMATIVEETNRYARQVLGDAADGKWVDVDADEMWAFMGFILLMGINKLPQMHQYWCRDPVFHYLPIAGRIPRDRFFAIWRFFHFTTNPPTPSAACASSSASSASASSSSPPGSTRPVD